MPRMVFYLIALFSLISCIENPQRNRESIRQVAPLETYNSLINEKSLNDLNDIDFNDDISIINQDYPIEIWLYENNKYYYDLPNLGSGIGTWSHSEGQLLLNNDHLIESIGLRIDMDYQLFFNGEEKTYLEFSDRFGKQNLEVKPTR